MNKKGLSYIDWSISIGIFVIFVLVLFILVVPSLDRKLDESYLITLAENGIKGETYYEILSLPLFIDSNSMNNIKISVDLPDYPVRNNGDSIVVTNEDFIEINSDSSINFGPVTLNNGVNQFNVLYLIGEIYSSSSPTGSVVTCGNEVGCTFGIEEKLIGFSKSKLDILFQDSCANYENYIEFKNDMSYPEQKEISIVISNENLILYNCTFKDPESLDAVYALTWKDKILNVNGNLEKVNVLVKTW